MTEFKIQVLQRLKDYDRLIDAAEKNFWRFNEISIVPYDCTHEEQLNNYDKAYSRHLENIYDLTDRQALVLELVYPLVENLN